VLRAKYLGTVVAIKQLDNDVKRCMNKVDLDKYIARERAMTFFAHPHLVQVEHSSCTISSSSLSLSLSL